MGILDYIVGRMGLAINPQTGKRVRVRSHGTDDWGNTADHVEEQQADGTWKRKGDVPGSGTGGHYG